MSSWLSEPWPLQDQCQDVTSLLLDTEESEQQLSHHALGRVSVGPARMQRSVAVGKEAALHKELMELRRSYQELKRKHDGTECKSAELRTKLRDAKAALASQDRKLEVSQKMVQRLASERAQLQAACDDSKLYARRLEAKVTDLKDQADLGASYAKAKKQAACLQARLAAAEAELAACEDVNRERTQEVHKLYQALEIRAGELSQEGGGDVQARLLYSLAESREEALALAKQLSQVKAEQGCVAAAAARLSDELAASQALRAEAEAAVMAMHERFAAVQAAQQQQEAYEVQEQTKALKAELRKARGTAKRLAEERDASSRQLAAAQAECEQLRTMLEEERRHHQRALAHAVSEAQAAAQAAEARSAQRDAAARSQREALLEQRCVALAAALEEVEGALAQERHSVAREERSKDGRLLVLESQVAAGREREGQLQQQLASLQRHLGELEQAKATSAGELEKQVTTLEAAVRLLRAEKEQLSLRLRQDSTDTHAELHALRQAAEGARATAAAREAAAASAMREVRELRVELGEAREAAKKLARSKEKLQRAMLEQISAVRARLQQAELQSLQQQQLLVLANSPNVSPGPRRSAAQGSSGGPSAHKPTAADSEARHRSGSSMRARPARHQAGLRRSSSSNAVDAAAAGLGTDRGMRNSRSGSRHMRASADSAATAPAGQQQRVRAASAGRVPAGSRGALQKGASTRAHGSARTLEQQASDIFGDVELGDLGLAADDSVGSQANAAQQQHHQHQHWQVQQQRQKQQGWQERQQREEKQADGAYGMSSPSGSSEGGHGAAWRSADVYDAATGQLYHDATAFLRPQQPSLKAAAGANARSSTNAAGGPRTAADAGSMQQAGQHERHKHQQQVHKHVPPAAGAEDWAGGTGMVPAGRPPAARGLAGQHSMEEPYSLPMSLHSTPRLTSDELDTALHTPERRAQRPPQPQLPPLHLALVQQQQQQGHQQLYQHSANQELHSAQQAKEQAVQPGGRPAEPPAAARLAAARETLQRLKSGRLGGVLDAQPSSSSLHQAAKPAAVAAPGHTAAGASSPGSHRGQPESDGFMSPPSTGRGHTHTIGSHSRHSEQPVYMRPLAAEDSSRSGVETVQALPSGNSSHQQPSRRQSGSVQPWQQPPTATATAPSAHAPAQAHAAGPRKTLSMSQSAVANRHGSVDGAKGDVASAAMPSLGSGLVQLSGVDVPSLEDLANLEDLLS